MPSEYYIEKNRVLPPSQDFQFLLKEGLQYIEKLGSKFWTDYNAHDPGITILDVLCYAITELGYRSDFDIKDLLTNEKGLIENKTFFSASNIFTNAPLTEIDFRKLLIDIDGVANAWLLATKKEVDAYGYFIPNDSEAQLYINKLEDKLSLKSTDKKNIALSKLQLRGLNKIKIELEDDPILGDLNTLILEFSFWEKTRWINLKIVPQFTEWHHPDTNLFEKMDTPLKIIIESVKKVQDIVHLVVKSSSKPSDSLHFRIFSEDKNEIDLVVLHFKTKENVCEIISLFKKKKDKIQEIFSTIAIQLHQNRNLTDDYLCTQIIEKVDIGICADIEIEAGADSIDVMSQIQIAIDSIISPKINFYSLSQLVKEGYHSEDIFLGPRLTHGFLKDEEIEKAQLTNEIHASDIIAVLMEIKGLKSVKNVLMTAYTLLGKPIPNAINKSWVLTLNGEVKPVFNAQKSKLLLFQKNIPFLLSENQLMMVEQKVIMYKTLFNQKKLKEAASDFEIENGTYYPLNSYHSIQDEFPVTYGLGKNYLSDKETDLRKAQAKQLKGYLLFYEQILADFFSQLYNAKELFNTDVNAVKKTYFPIYLDKDVETGNDFYSKELYTADLKKALLEGKSDDDISLYESKTLYYDRKNRALDHLMARFAESFNDYVFMMYQVSIDTSGMGSLSFDYDDLILDKQNFINVYPEISRNRGLGIDYLNATILNNALNFNPFWNTDHRGGYEKRVAKLLGINEIPLRNIVTEEGPQAQWKVETLKENFLFKIITPSINLGEKWDWAQLHFLDQNLYKIDKVGVHFYLHLVDGSNKIAKLERKFTSEIEAFEYLQKMINTLNLYYENFYCLEHILLRPFNNKTFSDDDLLSVCLNDECDDVANNDPYSFKATIVLPGYLSRFKNLTFRKYAEKIFRQEAPAQVLLKICWVNAKDLLAFQKKYKIWLENYRQYRLDFCKNMLTPAKETKYKKELNDLVLALKELNTIYPEGNLYDCQLSESINPIILGNTSLGTL